MVSGLWWPTPAVLCYPELAVKDNGDESGDDARRLAARSRL
jgi:hypothetical protein